ncbi:flippase [Halocatena salina]|uniref:Flippase n=1 Tax=Halocatena salina TaxID=2934340 RepID=A0A8U0A184_9EURY|nr:flippase [Halocatena salina]UPM42900.1 flippase [Halocatena salina]
MRGLQAMLVAEGARMVSKGLIVIVLANYFLSPDEYGLLFLSLSVLGTGLLFSYLGFAKSAARYITEYKAKDPTQIPHIITTSLQYNLVSIIVVSTTFVLGSGFIAGMINEPAIQPFLVVGSLYVATMTLSKFTTVVFQGFNRVRWSACIGALSNVSLLVFTVGFLLAGLGAIGALAGYVLGHALAAVVGLGVIFGRFIPKYAGGGGMDSELPGKILRYSIPLTITRSGHTLDKDVDTILVGFFLNPAAVGFYVLGKQIADFVTVPATSLGFAVSPAYGEQKASNAIGRAGELYEHAFVHTIMLYLPAGAGLILVSEPTIRYVFGAEYLGAVPVVQVFGVYIILRAIDKITNDGLDFVGRARDRAIAKTGASVGNVILNVLLIPVIGVVGAALSTVITYTALIGVEIYIINQEFPIARARLGRKTLLICAITALMSVVVVVLLPLVTDLVSLLTVIAIAGGVWAGLALVSGLIDIALVQSFIKSVTE